jgi:hypothetical protein
MYCICVYVPVCPPLSPNAVNKKYIFSIHVCAASSTLSLLAVTVIVMAVYTTILHSMNMKTGPAKPINLNNSFCVGSLIKGYNLLPCIVTTIYKYVCRRVNI